ncbi:MULTISPECIES: hypothetical protein [Acetobacter]|uniref:Uncharacterized protein n=2 Tax=Acetobacter TaxID=434 RepID=A0AAN1PFD5_9PROT|nr:MULTISPECIES: hypothetical protein [Acetobacter]ASL39486.1 hypothetical protein CBI36_02820 [Acetobacter oryzifermentans]ASL41523.1 hypothetical protein CBI36_14790 [Acetobacter oryzifermentans]AXC25899.1 hypothetical protein DS739_03270 [Acetobacter sp. JWB]AXC27590.1 hypothetical protein DS739_13130 [Acetobacter sp. JWB]AXM99155.1 hypothetical protein CJF59_00145 [Acetobacter pomorum]
MSRLKNAKSARRFFRRRPLNVRALRESARVQPDLSMQSRVSGGFTWRAPRKAIRHAAYYNG